MLGLQDGVDLSEGGDGKALLLFLHLQSFQSHNFIRLLVFGSVDDSVSAFLDAVQTLELLHAPTALNHTHTDRQTAGHDCARVTVHRENRRVCVPVKQAGIWAALSSAPRVRWEVIRGRSCLLEWLNERETVA